MQRVHYISTSLLPSQFANSIHVIHQCCALSKQGCQVVLYAKRAMQDPSDLNEVVSQSYGADLSNVKLVTFFKQSSRADALMIALMSWFHIMLHSWRDMVLSRNLYAAYILSLLGRPITYETHDLEFGFRKKLQKFCLTRSRNHVVVISKKLSEHLASHHEITLSNVIILHDAAPGGMSSLSRADKDKTLEKIMSGQKIDWKSFECVAGYFGQLYEGRGIDIIEEMARLRPTYLFLIFGGNPADVSRNQEKSYPNMVFFGHVPNRDARRYQKSVDALLMPYQRRVSIGIKGHDTAQWMSPMKLFEYMASGVPLISSDLPVLREVLTHKVNGMLAMPENVQEWVEALDELSQNKHSAQCVAQKAFDDYEAFYTWDRRAASLLKLSSVR